MELLKAAMASKVSTDAEALTSDGLGDCESSVISKRDKDPGAQLALYVLQLLESYEYTIPTFTLFHERLWHGVCQVVEEDDHLSVVDVFFSVPQLIPPFSVKVLKFCRVRVEEIQAQIPLRDLRLYKGMVLVVWDCDITDDTTERLDTRQNLMEENESLLVSDSTGDECEPPPSSGAAPFSHTVVFKCIGAVRDTQSQRVLYQAKNKHDSGWTVPVRKRPEPPTSEMQEQ